MRTILRDILITVILALAIFLLLQFTVQNFIVVGASMQPNFQDGERVVISKLAYNFGEPERGDVIVFHPPNNQDEDYIKRVIALPGEMVAVNDGVVYIDDQPLDEPYIKDLPAYALSEQRVPSNEYFVLGDNRNNSNDSHNGWTVPQQNIIGKVWLTIWPPEEWGVVPSYSAE
jgi:signal peptidase I